MDVYLIPVGPGRYEPYSEPTEHEPPAGTEASPQGWLRQAWTRFREMIRAAEAAERDGARPRNRLSERLLRWVAERVAEQRLLWQLRSRDAATLHHPPDLEGPAAVALMRTHLERDWKRHRRWVGVDAVLAAITGPLFFFVPGPNLIAYFFVFRAVGHYLSYRGAQQGLNAVRWTPLACPLLDALRDALTLTPGPRRAQVRDIAAQLRLPRLPLFVDRVAVKGA